MGQANGRHIGILLHSVEGALLCYSTAVHEAMRWLGKHRHPTITMSGRAMDEALAAWDADDHAVIRAMLAEDLGALARAGAEFFVLPDNTAHIALETDGPDLPLPGLHIAEEVATSAVARGFAKVGILGTRWTMEGPVYRRACEARGIGWAVPDEATRKRLHAIIMDELCMGVFEQRSIEEFRNAVDALRAAGCDCVALVCTEIPLIINDANSSLPVLDSTRLLARAAVDVALGERPLPTWCGGPVTDS
ncbi:MAG: amino acid racemase [Sphingomonas sp.]|uniref:aspartate/glutamate racemase family protein n=1 Tax=Sphingomonas sp. TaxID=28214 RepID=UPI001844A8FA|nr:amino acid racemase [Sphingomonas sp.]MBA3667146.1 amino acid racemase [Sphingomonas sp.]